jgi:alpha-D-ribose 1-methylphosphonate 5-triphosphate diphosphatase
MQILTNCRIVLEDEVVTGTVAIDGALIHDVQTGRSSLPSAIDLEGRLLAPGLVELHTDNLEKHLRPRTARWPGLMALYAHDAVIRGAGITTVLDAICIGVDRDFANQTRDFVDDTVAAHDAANQNGGLGADHFLHFRCELPHPELIANFDRVASNPALRLVSLMDHTPGQRQTADLAKLRKDYEKMGPVNDEWFVSLVAREQELQAKYSETNRKELAARVRELPGVVLASHDDSSGDHIDKAIEEGARISEFPTTLEAARLAKQAGLITVMGAPNIVLGGSQSGNLCAKQAVEAGLIDVFSSDYAPVSLLNAAMQLSEIIPLPQAIAMVSSAPAEAAGFQDRGRIAVGKRADLIEVSWASRTACVHKVWREGVRVG